MVVRKLFENSFRFCLLTCYIVCQEIFSFRKQRRHKNKNFLSIHSNSELWTSMSGYRSYRRSSALPSHFSSSSSLSSYTPSRSASFSNLRSFNSSPYTSSSYDSSRRGSLSSYKYPSYSSYNLNSFQSDPSSYRSRSASRTSSSNKSESDITHSASNKLSSSNGSSDDGKDYKKLYEESLLEVERLKKEFAAKEQEFNREKRQQQRKISEYEEELKMLEILRSDNQRLKDENGALIRVISKLSK